MKPTPLGLAAITPRQMSSADIDDLVVRAQDNAVSARAHRIVVAGAASGAARSVAYRMTPSRIAAHLIAFTGLSISDWGDLVGLIAELP